MQTRYHITATGIQHAIASIGINDSNNNSDQSLLVYLLKQNIISSVSFSDILNFFNNDKSLAFKKISKLISLQLIDISESEINELNSEINYFLDSYKTDNDYIFVDYNGFPITYNGFDQQQAINISTVAYDYIKAAKRSRQETEINSLNTPLSIKTSWGDLNIIIYLLHLENFSCLLVTKNTEFMNKPEFTRLASYLCNRYNYEQL